MRFNIPMTTFLWLPIAGLLTGVAGGLVYVGYKVTIHIAKGLLT